MCAGRSAWLRHFTSATPARRWRFATAYLRSHQETRLVTLTLGANDYFRFLKDCGVTPQPVGTCLLGFFGMLGVMQANLNTILGAIRATGYTGLIVAVTYYALDYHDTSGTALLNSPMVAAANANGALIASGLDAWAGTAAGGFSCAAGLLIVTAPGVCRRASDAAGTRSVGGEGDQHHRCELSGEQAAIGCLNRNRAN